MIVPKVVKDINHWIPENFSFTARIGTIVVPFPGLNETRSRSHIKRMEMIPTGSAIKNHMPHEGAGDMISRATMF